MCSTVRTTAKTEKITVSRKRKVSATTSEDTASRKIARVSHDNNNNNNIDDYNHEYGMYDSEIDETFDEKVTQE